MDRFDFIPLNMGIVKNIGEILSSPQMSSMSGASVRKYAREMGRTCTEYYMQFEKKITCTIRSLPKSQARHFTFRFIILQRVEDEEGARATPARIPVPPSHTELVEQTAICNSKLLNVVSRSSSPHRPPFRRAQTNVFSPPALSIFAIPRVEFAAEVEKSVCLVASLPGEWRRTGLFCKELKQLRAIAQIACESDGPDCDIIALEDFVTGGVIGEKAVAAPVAPVVALPSGRLRFSPPSTSL